MLEDEPKSVVFLYGLPGMQSLSSNPGTFACVINFKRTDWTFQQLYLAGERCLDFSIIHDFLDCLAFRKI